MVLYHDCSNAQSKECDSLVTHTVPDKVVYLGGNFPPILSTV